MFESKVGGTVPEVDAVSDGCVFDDCCISDFSVDWGSGLIAERLPNSVWVDDPQHVA